MVYVFLAQGFEEVEAVTPIDYLRRCGLEVITVGVGGKSVRGAHGIMITADISEDEVVLGGDLQMIILPGGMPGTLNLEKSEAVQHAAEYCAQKDIYIAAICAAPMILGHKGLLKGKAAVCYPGHENDLYGAEVIYDDVCVSGKIVTARSAGKAEAFSFKLAELLISAEKSRALANSLLVNR